MKRGISQTTILIVIIAIIIVAAAVWYSTQQAPATLARGGGKKITGSATPTPASTSTPTPTATSTPTPTATSTPTPTATSTPSPTPQTLSSSACSKTDGSSHGYGFNDLTSFNLNAWVAGTATDASGTFTDNCASSTSVNEYYCDWLPSNTNGQAKVAVVTCPYGSTCTNGACSPAPTPSPAPTCTDTDHGVNVFYTGQVYGYNGQTTGTFTDYCVTGTGPQAGDVFEYYCDRFVDYPNGYVYSAAIACPAGMTCSNGRCQ